MAPWRWSIVYLYLGAVVGHEQAGNRPALIVSDETFNQVMNVVTVLPVTTRKTGRQVYSNEIMLQAGRYGLEEESIVLAHQICTVSKNRIKRRVGIVSDKAVQESCLEAVRIHLGMY